MSISQVTILVLIIFLGTLVFISYQAYKRNIATPESYYVANRQVGAFVLLMTMGATFYSTWTLLGAYGDYYRSGVWFMGSGSWATLFGLFIWLFGIRIWLTGVKFNFVTPGEMIEHYYKSPFLRLLVTLVALVGVVPYMLIQIIGGALALDGITGGDIPYGVGISIMTILVALLVLLSGYRGAAWADTFMGLFYGAIVIVVFFVVMSMAGGFNAIKNVAEVSPHLVVNKGNPSAMLELMLGVGITFWLMPHMWQKFYSAKSPQVLGITSIMMPIWGAWLMATVPLFVGLSANLPGLLPGLNESNSDQLIPMFFAHYAPLFGTVVIAAIIAAAISTVNSQILSSASLFAQDIWVRFSNKQASASQVTWIGRITVMVLTGILFVLAFTPMAQGFLVPVANIGVILVVQLMPAALGPLYWKQVTKAGAISGIIAGVTVLVLTQSLGITMFLGPGANGLIVNFLVTWLVSLFTKSVPQESIENYHGMFKKYLSADEHEKVFSDDKQTKAV